MTAYDVNRLSVDEAIEYPSVWDTVSKMLPGASLSQIALIVSIVVDTCPHCYEHSRLCQCWNDE